MIDDPEWEDEEDLIFNCRELFKQRFNYRANMFVMNYCNNDLELYFDIMKKICSFEHDTIFKDSVMESIELMLFPLVPLEYDEDEKGPFL